MNKRKELYREVECPDGSIKKIRVWPAIDNDCNNNKKVPNDDLIIDNEDDNNEADAFFASLLEPYIPKEKETLKERKARYNAKTIAKRKENGKQKKANDRNNPKYNAKNKANGQKKVWNDRNNPKYNAKNKANGQKKVWNDKTNPKNNAKKKQNLKEEYDKYLIQHDREEEILTPEQYEEIIKKIHEKHPKFNSIMLTDGGYLGLTRQALEDEYLRWLSTRGRWMKNSSEYTRGQTYSRNRPTLLYPDGTHVTQKEAEDNFGFYGVVLFETPYLQQAATVEEMLQRHYQDEVKVEVDQVGLVLGKRLWRYPGMGSKYARGQKRKRIYKVFLASSVYLQEAITKGELVVQK